MTIQQPGGYVGQLDVQVSASEEMYTLEIYWVGQKEVYSCEYAKQLILVLSFINCYIIFHSENCKPTFAQLCTFGSCQQVHEIESNEPG